MSGLSEVELRPMRRLWRAVLGEQLKLALGGANRLAFASAHCDDAALARGWLKTQDFEMVCVFAGFDPDMVREAYRARRDDPEFDMGAYWREDRRGKSFGVAA